MLTPKQQDEFDSGILPASRDFPEQFAAGMQELIDSKLTASVLPLGSLPEGTRFRFHHGVVAGEWRMGKPDSRESSDPRCYRIGAESSNKPFSRLCKVIVTELPPERRKFRAGDVVKHEPSGEEWLLATDEGNGLVWTQGWPESLEAVDELSLVEAATDDERLKALRVFATHDGPRGRSARVQLEAEPVAPVDPFDSAEYYDACQNGELSCWSPEDAIAEYFDNELPEKFEAVTVTAYRSGSIPDEWFALTAQSAADFVRERFDETELLGNPTDVSRVSAAQLAAGANLLESALRQMFSDVTPWHCDQVATREYSAAEVEAILRECRPEWFVEDKP